MMSISVHDAVNSPISCMLMLKFSIIKSIRRSLKSVVEACWDVNGALVDK